MNNPWNLTEREIEITQAMITTGSLKGAAAATGLTTKSVEHRLQGVKKKMGGGNRLGYLFAFDRWVQKLNN